MYREIFVNARLKCFELANSMSDTELDVVLHRAKLIERFIFRQSAVDMPPVADQQLADEVVGVDISMFGLEKHDYKDTLERLDKCVVDPNQLIGTIVEEAPKEEQ